MAQAEHLPITRTPARHQRGMTCSVLVSVCATEKTRRPVLVAEHAQEISVDGKRLAVVGNSVGGNKAAVVSLMAKDRGTPKIKYQVLLWPVTDANFQNASYHQFAEGHFLTRNMMKWFWDNYTPDPKQRQDAYASPLQATTERLRDLPPALTLTGLLGLASPQLSALGSGAFGSAGLALAAPLFDAQALGFQQRAAEAQAKQVLAQYQQTILVAFREVEDALVGVGTARSRPRRKRVKSLRYDRHYISPNCGTRADFPTIWMCSQPSGISSTQSLRSRRPSACTWCP